MNEKYQRFEEEGLHIENNRVLVYSKINCPMDCRYCFVSDVQSVHHSEDSYLSKKQLELAKELPQETDLIMLGCDTEFFVSKNNPLEALKRLTSLNKDISVITKLKLSKDVISQLKEIDRILQQKGNFLVFSMSIPCFDSAKYWEPKTPSQ